ncbi:MAG: hypothetical protein K8E66_00220 [Phycisphaerales bacterium]|nr:hypothetical protein [Phycisphaerales bacterium]
MNATVWRTVLVVVLAVGLGGCASTPGEGDGSVQGAKIDVRLVVFGVDPDASRQSTGMRWINGMLDNAPIDPDTPRERPVALLNEAESRLTTTAGNQFLVSPRVLTRSGSRAVVGLQEAAGTRLDISVRPRTVEGGAIRVDVRVDFIQDRFEREGMWRNVRFAPPTLRYGTAPIVLKPGASGVVRLKKEVGTLQRPASMDVYAFVSATVVE